MRIPFLVSLVIFFMVSCSDENQSEKQAVKEDEAKTTDKGLLPTVNPQTQRNND